MIKRHRKFEALDSLFKILLSTVSTVQTAMICVVLRSISISAKNGAHLLTNLTNRMAENHIQHIESVIK